MKMVEYTMCMARGQKDVEKLMTQYDYVKVRGKKHIIWRDDDGNQVVTGASTSNYTASIKNLEARLKRYEQNKAT
jgi:hypothetical protein